MNAKRFELSPGQVADLDRAYRRMELAIAQDDAPARDSAAARLRDDLRWAAAAQPAARAPRGA